MIHPSTGRNEYLVSSKRTLSTRMRLFLTKVTKEEGSRKAVSRN